jgi:hypothetical protein
MVPTWGERSCELLNWSFWKNDVVRIHMEHRVSRSRELLLGQNLSESIWNIGWADWLRAPPLTPEQWQSLAKTPTKTPDWLGAPPLTPDWLRAVAETMTIVGQKPHENTWLAAHPMFHMDSDKFWPSRSSRLLLTLCSIWILTTSFFQKDQFTNLP